MIWKGGDEQVHLTKMSKEATTSTNGKKRPN